MVITVSARIHVCVEGCRLIGIPRNLRPSVASAAAAGGSKLSPYVCLIDHLIHFIIARY